jgi:hypothetical protein
VLGAQFFEFSAHRHEPAFKDIDNLVANLGGPEGDPVYEPTSEIDLARVAMNRRAMKWAGYKKQQ